MVDSLLLGCIPVFFENDDEWKNMYSHFVNMTDVGINVRPSDIKYLPYILKSVNVTRFQQNIRENAVRLSSPSAHIVGDAIDTFAKIVTSNIEQYWA